MENSIEIKCNSSYNLSRVGLPEERIRRICMGMETWKKLILTKLVTDAGGYLSHGYCKPHSKEALEEAERAMEETKIIKKENIFKPL